MVLFFTHILFVVNHTINATPPKRLQQYQHLVKTLRQKLEISKFVHFAENFQKIIITTLKLIFSNFWHFSNLFWLFFAY